MEQDDSKRINKSKSAFGRSLLITLVYAFIGYAWIIVSDLVLSRSYAMGFQSFMISVSKGLGFVTVTAIIIFCLVYTNFRKVLSESSIRKRNETMLNDAQRIAHVGNFSFDANTLKFTFSEEAMRILELDESEFPVTYEVLMRHVHIDDRDRVFSLAQEATMHGSDASFDCRLLQSQSPERNVHVLLKSVIQKESGLPYIVGTMQDITDRVEAQEAAKEKESFFKALLNSSYDLIYLKDSTLRYVAVNTNMQQYYGINEAYLIGKQLSEIKPGEDAIIWESRDRSVLISGQPLFIEDSNDGKYFETIIFPVEFSGSKRGVGGISRDITQRKQTEAIVIQERDRAQTYFDIAAILFVAYDRDGNVTMINRAGCNTIGLPKEQLIGKQWVENFVPESEREGVYEVFREIYGGKIDLNDIHENGILNINQEIRQIEWRNTVLRDVNGNPSGILSAGVDVSDLRKTIEALQESERSKSVLLSNLPGMAYRCAFDRNWTMHFASSGCFELTGYLPEEIIDNAVISFNDIICPEYREPVWEDNIKFHSSQHSNQFEYEITTASGERKWVLDINQGITDKTGKILALEGIIVDITKSKLQFLQIQYLSNHDQLTGLHNRLHFDNARKRFGDAASLPLSMAFIDINGLKLINDAFGYDAGDRMIQTTAAIIRANLLPNEIVSRIGGDEFGLLLPNTDQRACVERMQTLKEAFDHYNTVLQDKTLIINVSIGGSTRMTQDDDLALVTRDAEANMARHKLFDQKSHHNAVLTSIMATLFARSFETEEHAKRIGDLCAIIGAKINLSHDDIDRLRLFAYLHDIGKIGISDQILNKPGPLNEEELVVMKTHPEIGYRIAMSSPDFASIADLILTHHERWDGTGYPNHLSGEKIPLLSRILAVSDAYDAMTEDRVYRKALSPKAAMEEIRNNAGTQFDPKIAETFLEIVERDDL